MPFNKFYAILAVLLMAAPMAALIPMWQPYSAHSNIEAGIIHSGENVTQSNEQYYIAYFPGTYSGMITTELGLLGVSYASSGGFMNIYPNEAQLAYVSNILKIASKDFGIQYALINGTVTSTPYDVVSQVTPDLVIPYAFVPSQIASAYNFTWEYRSGYTGSGITIGIVDAYGDPNLAYDLKAFDELNGLPPANLSVAYPEGQPGNGTYNASWALETATDVEWAHAMAPNATILLYIAPSAITQTLQFAVSDMVDSSSVNIISLSWGNPEIQLTQREIGVYSQIYREAYLKGITVVAATGDSGSDYYGANGTGIPTVNFPSSDPYVTAVGGTSLSLFDGKYSQTAWGGLYEGQSFGSGGGYSRFFSTPYWQSAPGFNSTERGTPDVSLDANQYTGMIVVVRGKQYEAGGTSIATPIWAAAAAIMDQATHRNLGFLNPLLYQISRTPLYNSSFEQIRTGTNGAYSAAPGWNPVTGLGTPSVSGLVNATEKITAGFGGQVLLQGNATYASSVYSVLNLSVNTSNMKSNGSGFYYVGLYNSPANYIEFGVNVSASAANYMMRIGQSGYVRTFYGPQISGSWGPLHYISNLSLTYKNGWISATSNSSREISVPAPVFLNYAGNSTPVAGGVSIGSYDNLTDLGNFTFSSLTGVYNGTQLNSSGMYFQRFSGIDIPGYSSLNAAINGTEVEFSRYIKSSPPAISYGPPAPLISYMLNFSLPVHGSFHLSNYTGSVEWKVNGTSIAGNTYSFPATGYYNITASEYVDRSRVNETRIIYIPDMVIQNVSVHSDVSHDLNPPSSIVVDYFSRYAVRNTSAIPVVSGTNDFAVSSTGFRTESLSNKSSGNLTIELHALPVPVSAFLFQGNATVTIQNVTVAGENGTFSGTTMPGVVWINATAPGFIPLNLSTIIMPGTSYRTQILLQPESSSMVLIQGTVNDAVYAFPVAGAVVSVSNQSYSYTNSTGYYRLYEGSGTLNISASANLYESQYKHLVLKFAPLDLNFSLKPLDINISSMPFITITRYFPLFFFMGVVTWSGYSGKIFSEYQLYVSQNAGFFNPRVITFTSPSSTSTVISGIYPGHTYYATIVLRLSDGEVYQSSVVKITYSNPVYLGMNIAIVGGIAIYLAFMGAYLRRRWKKTPVYP
ncbi:MAG: S8 family serine peptidase [Candidatus Thermoplasmatota archaeon]|nr:S8 family serine peptidase [Candidatus Thermoplasmatota archaeon]